jgi:PadR family transcriptional regulator, regulatory protein AphA
MSRGKRLTTTSYAILSLLGLRSWSSYELTQQMGRSLGRIWPRAESKIYEEPKKLEALGLARATRETVGERPRTVWTITPAGRRALTKWMSRSATGPVLEWEQLVKLFFAEHGSKADALARIDEAHAWAVERNEDNLRTGRAYLAGEAEFQERVAVNMLSGGFLTEHYRMVAEWARWARAVVETWPDDPAEATPDRAAMERVVARASWSEDSDISAGGDTRRGE